LGIIKDHVHLFIYLNYKGDISVSLANTSHCDVDCDVDCDGGWQMTAAVPRDWFVSGFFGKSF